MKTLLKFIFCTLAIIAGAAIFTNFDMLASVISHSHNSISLAFVPFGIISTERGRFAYEMFKRKCSMINACFPEASIIINEDHFLSEAPVANNVSQYKFETWEKVMQTQTNRPLQRGVNDNDVFAGIGYRITIDHRVKGQSNVNPQTYPNPLVFTAANTGDVNDLYTIFNGEWSLEVGRTVYIPNMTTRTQLLIPVTQKTVATNESAYEGARFFFLDPFPILSGKADNELLLNVDLYAGWAGASIVADDENVISFEMPGLTLQNAAGFVDYITGKKDIEEEYDKKFGKGASMAIMQGK